MADGATDGAGAVPLTGACCVDGARVVVPAVCPSWCREDVAATVCRPGCAVGAEGDAVPAICTRRWDVGAGEVPLFADWLLAYQTCPTAAMIPKSNSTHNTGHEERA